MSECMTQEDAMHMSNEQAIQILKPMMAMMRDQHGCPISDAYFAIEKAIEALKTEVVRCRDCQWQRDCEESVGSEYFCADGEKRKTI